MTHKCHFFAVLALFLGLSCPFETQAANSIYPPHMQPLNVAGYPYPGAKLYCMTVGGSWPGNAQAVYSDYLATVALSNPVVADGAGKFPTMYLPASTGYKFWLTDASGNTLWTDDNAYGSHAEWGGSLTFVSTTSTAAVIGTNSNTGAGVSGISTGTGPAVKASSGSGTGPSLYVVPQTSIPANPAAGYMWVNSTSGQLQVYDGSAWEISGQKGSLLNVRNFAGSGTYTPTAGMKYFYAEAVGGGGGGAAPVGASNQIICGAGGGSGAYAAVVHTYSAGETYAVTVGASGAGGNPGAGANGTASVLVVSPGSVTILSADFGHGSLNQGVSPNASFLQGGLPGVMANCVGDLKITGGQGGAYWVNQPGGNSTNGTVGMSGIGATGFFGPGGVSGGCAGTGAGVVSGYAGVAYGSGGGGACACNLTGSYGAETGGAGAGGLVRIWEFG